MPTPAHENAVIALRQRPELLAQLVRKLLGERLDPRLLPIDATLRLANPQEVRPDIVFVGRRRHWVAVEIQNKIDWSKRRRWPLVASVLFNDHGVPGDIIVITASRHVARWAARVASAQGPLGMRHALEPVILLLAGPAIEALLDPAYPELALFAAWAMQHRRDARAKATVRRALELTRKLPRPLRGRQQRAILNVLSESMVKFVREVLMDPNKTPESPWFRELRLELEALGEARGKAEGKAEGRAEGKQEALLVLLATRELPVSAAQKKRIEACVDLEVLDRWLRAAVSADTVGEVLAPARSRRKPTVAQRSAAPRRRASRV